MAFLIKVAVFIILPTIIIGLGIKFITDRIDKKRSLKLKLAKAENEAWQEIRKLTGPLQKANSDAEVLELLGISPDDIEDRTAQEVLVLIKKSMEGLPSDYSKDDLV